MRSRGSAVDLDGVPLVAADPPLDGVPVTSVVAE